MKIYETTPPYLVRIQVDRIENGKHNRHYLTLCETTPEEVEQMCREVIEANKHLFSPFESDYKTRIDIREALGGKNGKSKSLSFHGLDPKTTMELIIKHIKQHEKK